MFYIKINCFFILLFCFLPALFSQEEAPVQIEQVAAKARYGKHLYLKFSGGFTTYGGDTDNNPANEVETYLNDKGLGGRLELGKTISEKSDIGLALTYGDYTQIEPNEIRENSTDAKFEDTNRFRAELLWRYHPINRKKIDPYLQIGAHLTSGQVYKKVLIGKIDDYKAVKKTGYGPSFGGGITVKLNNTFGAFLETSQNLTFPDIAVDGANYEDQLNSGGDDTNYDWLGYYGAGVSLNLGAKESKPSCVAPSIKAADYSGLNQINEPLTFRALIDEPAELIWEFGDGSTAMGENALYQYPQAGEYQVTVTATNACGMDKAVVPLQILYKQECTDIEVVAISASKFTAQVNENIQFYASVSGAVNANYKWDFGDGATAEVRTANHTYAAPGSYQVHFTATNSCEVETKSVNIEVKPATLQNVACAQITQLNAVYFEFGSTQLDSRAKAKLDENIDLLKTCPTAKVKVLGYTDNVEQPNPLSEIRAQSVLMYYQQNGLSIEQLMMEGKGEAPINCDKEDPGRGCRRNRRADSIPMLY